MFFSRKTAAAALALVMVPTMSLAFGCSTERSLDDTGDPDGGGGDTDTGTETDTGTDTGTEDDGSGCGKMDILFVIDDSDSMGCEQEMLGVAFPGFIDVLEEYSNSFAEQVEYRVGVTSTGRTMQFTYDLPDPLPDLPQSMNGLDGELVTHQGQKWIDGPGSAEASSWFSYAASLGTSGPSYEMPLYGMRMALEKDAPGEPNEGFLRDDSLFIAVIITDEDDCSRIDEDFVVADDSCMTPEPDPNLVDLQEYKIYLDERFGGPSRYVVVTIAGLYGCDEGAYPTTCDESGSYAGALAAERLVDFMTNYVGVEEDDNGIFADICTMNMAEALAEALEKMEVACDEFVPPE